MVTNEFIAFPRPGDDNFIELYLTITGFCDIIMCHKFGFERKNILIITPAKTIKGELKFFMAKSTKEVKLNEIA